VAVAVRDTGPGIPPEDLSRLFVEFSQLDGSASRSQPGTGLGLALSRQFVDLHGGAITAESSPGTGTEFRFLLPVDGPLPAPDTSATPLP
jgi:signal transduction histidine kinase